MLTISVRISTEASENISAEDIEGFRRLALLSAQQVFGMAVADYLRFKCEVDPELADWMIISVEYEIRKDSNNVGSVDHVTFQTKRLMLELLKSQIVPNTAGKIVRAYYRASVVGGGWFWVHKNGSEEPFLSYR